jgi:hypothetical protein
MTARNDSTETLAQSLYLQVLHGELTMTEASAISEAAVRKSVAKDGKLRSKQLMLLACEECGGPLQQTNATGRGTRTRFHPECGAFRRELRRAQKALDALRQAQSEACGCGQRCEPGACETPKPRLSWHQAKAIRSELWSMANSLNPLCKGVDNDSR